MREPQASKRVKEEETCKRRSDSLPRLLGKVLTQKRLGGVTILEKETLLAGTSKEKYLAFLVFVITT